MADQGWDDGIYFNGIDGETGDYLTPAVPLQELVSAIKASQFPQDHFDDLTTKLDQEKPGYPIPEYLGDSSQLAISGWGMLFPASADPQHVDDILEAMHELVQLRLSQAGKERCIILRGAQGFRWESGKPETKNKFLARHGVSPGNFDATKMPFHLLIVADPLSIPFSFQHDMDVDYACGRIYFSSLEQYARVAHSIWLAEKGKVALPPRASFFGVHNRLDELTPGDIPTALSKHHLIDPLAQNVNKMISQKNLAWQTQLIAPEDADREALKSLLGGSQTPALLFTASHGMGWSKPDPVQTDLQGALVCADWKGPESGHVQREHYLAAADLPETSVPLGLIAFFFACYGAGTPYRDSYAIGKKQKPAQIAHRPFLAALPMQLLSHPNGGALAVVGHVERALAHSFIHDHLTDQVQPFEVIFRMLLEGKTLGHALDWMNLRYASLAVSLKQLIEDEYASPGLVDPRELAYLWTAVNDAGGYAVLGDPAVRLAASSTEPKGISLPAFTLSKSYAGALPVVFDSSALPALSPEDQQAVAEENKKLGI